MCHAVKFQKKILNIINSTSPPHILQFESFLCQTELIASNHRYNWVIDYPRVLVCGIKSGRRIMSIHLTRDPCPGFCGKL